MAAAALAFKMQIALLGGSARDQDRNTNGKPSKQTE
jgi:hypothetical protein